MSDNDTWETINFQGLSYQQWNDEYFVYNPITNNTHVLNHLSWVILETTSTRTISTKDLLQTLTTALPEFKEELTIETLTEHLAQFSYMGLTKLSTENTDWLITP